jgi:hypothetical protein
MRKAATLNGKAVATARIGQASATAEISRP